MKDSWIFTMIIGAYLFGLFLGLFMINDDYEQGQIDALSGNIKYELITNPDSSRTWEEIK